MGGVKVAGGNCCLHLHLQQPLLPHAHHAHGFSSSPRTLSSIFSSISSSSSSSTRKTMRRGIDGPDHPTLTCQIPMKQRSAFLARTSSTSKLSRRPSLDDLKAISATRRGKHQILRRASSASLDSFAHGDNGAGDDELVRRLDELASNLHQEDSESSNKILPNARRNQQDAEPTSKASPFSSSVHRNPVSPSAVGPEPPNWLDRDEATLEMKACSVDLPVSLRIIKQQRKKKKREEGLREGGASACCSVEKAFSSMVFIVRELHSYTLQMREILFSEKNLQGILARVQAEMNASFVWLFQQIFSCTPTLMVYVMLLLANFTVYSIGHNSPAIAAQPAQAVVAIEQDQQHTLQRLDAPSIRSFSAGRRASVGGSGGGKVKPVAGATDDGDHSKGSSYHFRRRIIPDGRMSTASPPATVADESAATVVKTEEEEAAVWSGMVEEASKMQSSNSLQQLVSPVSVELEAEDQSVYLQTELMYHQALAQDPHDVLLLSNFAQFLYLVLHDHDRAEYYFKRAILGEKPADAEALNRYANFLWLARHDLGAAEETYLEAIAAADPSSCYYTANYAHFLWSTGGADTCYPLDGGDHAH